MLSTQQHVAARATDRITARVTAVADGPRDLLHAILASFMPDDDESRENMLMFVVLHTASLVDPRLARTEAHAVPDALTKTIAKLLDRASLRKGVDVRMEAILLHGRPGFAQAVLDGMHTPENAVAILDYAIARALH